MRGSFQRSVRVSRSGKAGREAGRFSLRGKFRKTFNKTKNGKKPARRRGAAFGNLVSAFMLVVLTNEASHFHPAHTPHGTRRERIEEIRQRLAKAEASSRHMRQLNAGGNGPQPHPVVQAAIEAERRRQSDFSQPDFSA